MKPRLFVTVPALLLLTFALSSFIIKKKDECGGEELTAIAVDQLKKFTMIQEYPFYFKKKKKSEPIDYKKQVITMNRGVRYKFFTVRNPEYDGLPVLTIYNSEKMDIMLGSTYNPGLKKFYNELEFECKTTGNYCLALSFQDGLEGCGLGVFASLIKN